MLRTLSAILLLAGTLPAAAQEARIAIASDIKTSEPGGRTRDTVSDSLLLHVVESLVAYRADLTVAPMLAQSFSVNQDATLFTFKLRSGVKFHNGATMTADDVKWSWDRMLDPKSDWLCRDWYDGSNGPKTELRVVDSATVEFKLDRPSPQFLDRMANFQCITAVLHRDSVDADGTWKTPVGTGPYRFAEWKKGESILLQRFDGYAASDQPASGLAGRKEAKIASLRWLVVPERAAQKAALLAGQVDVVPGLTPSDLPLDAARAQVQVAPGLDWNALLIQSKDPLFKDVRVRRAVALAIDAKKLAQAASNGTAEFNPSPIAASTAWHGPGQSVALPYDPAQAQKLLAEAGYRGQRVVLQTNKRFPNMYDNAVLLQAMLLKAGFNVDLEVVEWAAQLANYREGRFQLMSFGFSARTDPSLAYAAFVGDRSKLALLQWDDAEARAWLEEAARTADKAQRQMLFDRIHARMVEQVPILPLYNQPVIDAVAPRIDGYAAWSAGKPRLWNVTAR
jgi:peptide/nickel transport system substrate-binding protein